MLKFFKKIIFFLKKPSLIVVTGKDRSLAGDMCFYVLSSKFSVKRISDACAEEGQ